MLKYAHFLHESNKRQTFSQSYHIHKVNKVCKEVNTSKAAYPSALRHFKSIQRKNKIQKLKA